MIHLIVANCRTTYRIPINAIIHVNPVVRRDVDPDPHRSGDKITILQYFGKRSIQLFSKLNFFLALTKLQLIWLNII